MFFVRGSTNFGDARSEIVVCLWDIFRYLFNFLSSLSCVRMYMERGDPQPPIWHRYYKFLNFKHRFGINIKIYTRMIFLF